MDQNDIRTLKILEVMEQDHAPSQRTLATELNVSLGLVNSFIKRLANKGYFKIVNIRRNRVKYLLTPKGVTEKTRLTYEYIKLSYQFYNGACQKIRGIFDYLEAQGWYRVVFYGVSDFAEIAYVVSCGTPIKVVCMIDNRIIGQKFIDTSVEGSDLLGNISFDRILITDLDLSDRILSFILDMGISREKVILLGDKL